MNCKECRESLVPYLEKVHGAPATEVERHLAECDECRGEAATVRALRDRMVRLGEAEEGARSIEQAAQALDCNRSYVHVLRDQILTAAIQGAEARTPGPKPQPPSPEEAQAAVAAADRRALDAKVALELEQCRTELALVLGPRIGNAPKKKHRRR